MEKLEHSQRVIYLDALQIVPLLNKPVETSNVHMKTVRGE